MGFYCIRSTASCFDENPSKRDLGLFWMFCSLIGGQINFLFPHYTRLNLNSIDSPVRVGWGRGRGGGAPFTGLYLQ